jgi:Domain of unknown function (DUF4942)
MSETIIPRTTLSQLIAAYRQSDLELRQALALLLSAQRRLKESFRGDCSLDLARIIERHRLSFEKPAEILASVKRDTWRALFAHPDLRRFFSVAASKKLAEQIETDTDLPEIEVNALLAMFDGTAASAGEFLEEAVIDVFEFLRPRQPRLNTNSPCEIGQRVIIGGAVSHKWNSSQFRVNPKYEDDIRAVDNVFHALDGQGTVKTPRGPLVDAIEASSDGTGETSYFTFKCFSNGGLRLEFNCRDLLHKLNQIARGNHWQSPTGARQPPSATGDAVVSTNLAPISQSPGEPDGITTT